MSPVLVAVLAGVIGGSDGSQAPSPGPSATVESTTTPLSGSELREAVRAALRRWARPADADADRAAREFLSLYEALASDAQLAVSQREALQSKVRGRLLQLSDQISLRVAKLRREEVAKADSVTLPDGKGGPLAQGFGGVGFGAPMGMGMPPGAAAGLGGAPMLADDHGAALVELIQKTIRPTSWDINGGPGSIYYWYPGRALVIRQTDEAHEAIGGVLDQLQRAGR